MVNVTLDTVLSFVLILPSYFTYKCYPSGTTFRIPYGFLQISIRIIKTYLIYYFDSSRLDFIDYKTT